MNHNNEGFAELDDNSYQDFISENKAVLLDFWAPWCMPCLLQGRMLKKRIEELPKGARIAKINVDKNPKAAARFNVRGIPQMYLFIDGEPVKGWTGVTTVDVLFGEMSKYL